MGNIARTIEPPHMSQEQLSDLGGGAAQDAARPSSVTVPEEVKPEILAVIEAAASVFLRREVRVVSIKMSPASNLKSEPWAVHGRDIVQDSHNLVQRERH